VLLKTFSNIQSAGMT